MVRCWNVRSEPGIGDYQTYTGRGLHADRVGAIYFIRLPLGFGFRQRLGRLVGDTKAWPRDPSLEGALRSGLRRDCWCIDRPSVHPESLIHHATDMVYEKRPNKAPEPMRTAVTPRADARVAPSARMAHL